MRWRRQSRPRLPVARTPRKAKWFAKVYEPRWNGIGQSKRGCTSRWCPPRSNWRAIHHEDSRHPTCASARRRRDGHGLTDVRRDVRHSFRAGGPEPARGASGVHRACQRVPRHGGAFRGRHCGVLRELSDLPGARHAARRFAAGSTHHGLPPKRHGGVSGKHAGFAKVRGRPPLPLHKEN